MREPPTPPETMHEALVEEAPVTTCEPCAHADLHGVWPTGFDATHCPGCHRTWAGYRECHCARCHEQFSGPTIFAQHLQGATCMSPGEMLGLRSKRNLSVFATTTRARGEVWVSAALPGRSNPAWGGDT